MEWSPNLKNNFGKWTQDVQSVILIVFVHHCSQPESRCSPTQALDLTTFRTDVLNGKASWGWKSERRWRWSLRTHNWWESSQMDRRKLHLLPIYYLVPTSHPTGGHRNSDLYIPLFPSPSSSFLTSHILTYVACFQFCLVVGLLPVYFPLVCTSRTMFYSFSATSRLITTESSVQIEPAELVAVAVSVSKSDASILFHFF